MNSITNLHQDQNKVIVSMGYDNITTNIDLITGYGATLPDPSIIGPYNLIWWNVSDYLNPNDDPSAEIVKCIAKFGDTLIVMRSQQQTLASSKNIPGKLYNMVYFSSNDDNNLDTLSYYNVPQIHGISAHTGTIGTWASIDKTTSNIADITTRSHTSLTDIGTNSHPTIDTHIAATTGIHGATSSNTVNTIVMRDVNGDIYVGLVRATGGNYINPDYSFSGYTGNGMYLAGPNKLGFATAATERMVISSTGNVGIGETVPTAKLHVGGTPGTDGIKFPDGTIQTTAGTSGIGVNFLQFMDTNIVTDYTLGTGSIVRDMPAGTYSGTTGATGQFRSLQDYKEVLSTKPRIFTFRYTSASSVTTNIDIPAPAIGLGSDDNNFVGLQLMSTGWRLICKNGAGAPNITYATISIGANQLITIYATNTKVICYADGVYKATITTHIPTVALGIWIRASTGPDNSIALNYLISYPMSTAADKTSMFATVSNVTGSRAFGTVYQNTSETPMFVNAMIEEAGTGEYSLDIGSTNPPTIEIRHRMRGNNDGWYEMYQSIVPAGWYYRLRQILTGGGSSILSWIEQTG